MFAVGLSITSFILASEGLGLHAIYSVGRASVLMKCYYASEFLYISSICFSKLPLLVLFYSIVASRRMHRRLVLGLGAFIVIWSAASLLAVAFQCQLPRPWELMTLRCFNTVSIVRTDLYVSTRVTIVIADLLDHLLHCRHVI